MCSVINGGSGGGGANRPLPRDRGTEKLSGDATVEAWSKVWTRSRKWKNFSIKDGAPESFRFETVQKKVS